MIWFICCPESLKLLEPQDPHGKVGLVIIKTPPMLALSMTKHFLLLCLCSFLHLPSPLPFQYALVSHKNNVLTASTISSLSNFLEMSLNFCSHLPFTSGYFTGPELQVLVSRANSVSRKC